MSPIRWTSTRMDQLEAAARKGQRVALSRRGTEYVVVARRVEARSGGDVLIGFLPMTGEELTFVLGELDELQVIE